ncbi:class I mannose-6-phosphate isomerase [Sphingosinicella rhizophila]|uniref:Class I mannose-6-phosphate isomerase n=1 Tax=Sphingosinicella rhizophila TaxID=3050082 RepID=A0ABU3Q4E9_9SPHN|nr:class I mannose-6-phosphate isomerase [Sphingosinicella sp. GR2756]MDT9598157.1 class I mannose-6-phosphate isomerase [Sphingosinicella sp. GR2756]
MKASRLDKRNVEKVWGRQHLPRAFGADGACPVGEIWFQDRTGGDAELLIKYLLTSEKLSIQVHPDDAVARTRGYKRGKDEAWLIIDAEPGARIGLGLRREMTKEGLRAAALDGSIEDLIDWREARAGDFLYSPAGTIHALGPGLTLIEIQQNVDLTYRLYDYGRPRPLQLDEAIEAARPEPFRAPFQPYRHGPGRQILAEGPAFVVERWTEAAGGQLAGEAKRPVWLIPVAGSGLIDDEPLAPPEVWLVEAQSRVRIDPGSEMLFAYPGDRIIEDLLVDTRRGGGEILPDDRRTYVPPVRISPSFYEDE